MRLLVVLACLILSAPARLDAATAEGLRLELILPSETVPLGEPFTIRAVLLNESTAQVRVAPVFFFSHDNLELQIKDAEGDSLDAPSGALEVCGRANRDWLILLGAHELIGADFKVSPGLPESINYVYGIREGCYNFSGILHLHDFAGCIEGLTQLTPEPVRGRVRSDPKELCFGPPVAAHVRLFLSKLGSDQPDQVIEGLLYFSNVADPRASSKIRSLLGPPEDWPSRFADQFHAPTALYRQRDPANAPYFREALSGRFSALAAKALREVQASPSTPTNRPHHRDQGREPTPGTNSCSFNDHAGFRSALGPTPPAGHLGTTLAATDRTQAITSQGRIQRFETDLQVDSDHGASGNGIPLRLPGSRVADAWADSTALERIFGDT
jgi:hypothetical protein